jgi:hypothetical protein
MNTPNPNLASRLITFALEALKLFGIAIGCLALIGIAVFVSARTGIVIPARWFGFFVWTGIYMWIVCRQYKTHLRQANFWAAFLTLIAFHVAVFVVVLQKYPEWRLAWFPLVAIIEGPLIVVAVGLVIQRKRYRR